MTACKAGRETLLGTEKPRRTAFIFDFIRRSLPDRFFPDHVLRHRRPSPYRLLLERQDVRKAMEGPKGTDSVCLPLLI